MFSRRVSKWLIAVIPAMVCAATAFAHARPPGTIRMGSTGTIVAVHNGPNQTIARPRGNAASASAYPYPSPRLAGFQPFVAITTSSETSNVDIDYEHKLVSGYDCLQSQPPNALPCGALNPPANQNFIIGILDSGATSDVIAEPFATTLGLSGAMLTTNVVPLGGIGGTLDGLTTMPVGYYVAGLSAVSDFGLLDLTKVVGHWNSAGVWAPPVVCGDTFALTGLIGTDLIAFHNVVISVDSPRRVTLDGFTFKGPDVQLLDPLDAVPTHPHSISVGLSDFGPVTTASYFPVFDPEDLDTPWIPTALSFFAGSIPTGGFFMATVLLRQGPASNENPPTSARMLLDTGSQASVISRGMAADLSLPIRPDFTTEVCGIGGEVTSVSGYYIDYVKISALGGALEYSHAPFIVVDLPAPDGTVLDGILGMNFFWDRNVALEPALTESSFFDVSDPIPFAFGDYDADRHVDADDVFFWMACKSPPGGAVTPDCVQLDGDGDGDVDLKDFAGLQRCFSGLHAEADPNCGF